MQGDLTFKEVSNFLRKDDGKLIQAVDTLLGVAIICSPLIFGPQALPALGALKVKGELTKLANSVLEKAISKKESDYLARMRRMQMAYGLICFTAFFEALDSLLPNDLRKELDLQPEEKKHLVERAARRAGEWSEKDGAPLESPQESILDTSLPFPHPVAPFKEQTDRLHRLYDHMAKGLGEFLKKLALWEEADDQIAAHLRKALKELPATSLQCFEGQYIELARTYHDFFVWSRLQEHKVIQATSQNLSDYLAKYTSLLTESDKRIDIGFEMLQATVLSIPDQFKAVEAANVVDGLRRHYEARINDPIFEGKHEAQDGKPALNFPKICDAFVPQRYRVLRHTTKDRHLEREDTWDKLDRRNDLGAFLLSYLSSPYSVETPLLILGHPGSGKSLLTKVLSAKLMCDSYTPIRVPLREVDGDSPIENQIDEVIQRVTGHRISSWANFSSQFSQRPLVIFLDGYDELLQASGRVFAGYLKMVQQFQQREAEQGRPVRVVVTSRIALIDKATLPLGSTILRLVEFQEDQRNAWIEVWNNANAHYFKACNPPIQQFELPNEKKILLLAEQPLLLLMLALYDSEDNRLHEQKRLDRTVLYDSLLRRFIQREQTKNQSRDDKLTPKQKQDEIEHEMKRLGAAAIGMYNRRKLHVLSDELVADLKFFELERTLHVENGRPMTQADILLGSFFFIHKSQAGQAHETHDHEENTAFEFLHNTFGEFLTADFILRFTFQETQILQTYRQTEGLETEFLRKIRNPDGMAKEWFTCLMYSPLYSRPVVLEMLREWTSHCLQKRRFSRENLLHCLDEIIRSQIGLVLRSRTLPAIMQASDATRFADLPLLGHVAIYTLNLIILRTVLGKGEFVFDETQYAWDESSSDSGISGARPWDRLANIWCSWFSLDNLNGLSAILTARREKSEIIVTERKIFQISPSSNRIDTVQNVALTLADGITSGLAGLFAQDSSENTWRDLSELEKLLVSENINLELEFVVRRLSYALTSEERNYRHNRELIWQGITLSRTTRQRSPLVTHFFELVGKALRLKALDVAAEDELWQDLLQPGFWIDTNPHAAAEGLWLVREFGGHWLRRYGTELLERTLHPRYFEEMLVGQPDVVLELLRLMREVGDTRWFEHYGAELLERTLHPRYLEEMSASRPNAALELLRLMQGFSDTRWFERYGTELLERTLHPRYLEEMLASRPDVALEWLRLMQGFGDTRWFERYGMELLERTLHPHYFEEMLARQPDVALEWLRLMREVGDQRWFERYGTELLERTLYPRHFEEMIRTQPDVALEWLRLMRDVGDHNWFERYGTELLDRTLHPRYLEEMIRTQPDVALEWLHLMRDVGDHNWFERYGTELLERTLHPDYFEEMLVRQPDVALEWLRLAREVGDYGWFERYGTEVLERFLHPDYFEEMIRRQPGVALEWLRLAREVGDPRWIERYGEEILERLVRSGLFTGTMRMNLDIALKWLHLALEIDGRYWIERCGKEIFERSIRSNLNKVPLEYIRDVEWYAELTCDESLISAIQAFVAQAA